MNDLVKFSQGGLPANPDELVAGLQNVGQSLQGTTGGLPFLRLLKSGVFAYGPENIEPEQGSEWAINPYSLMHGWACWGEGELLDERMVPSAQPAPAKGELPDLGHSWGQQVSMQLQCLNGEDAGTVVLYKGTAIGLRNAVKELINKLIAQAKADPENIVPVVELEADSYTHKTYGQIFYPVLEVARWVSVETGEPTAPKVTDASAEETPAEAPEAAAEVPADPPPKRRVRRGQAAKAAETEGGDQPAPRRRRRAS